MELLRQVSSVCFVIALAVAAAYWFRKGARGSLLSLRGTHSGMKRMQLIQRVPLTAQHCLCLVRVDDKEWVLATHQNGLTIIEGKAAGPCGKEQTA